MNINPRFLDEDNVFGADGIPHTSDDGYFLTSDSPAIDNGAHVGLDYDMLGNSIDGYPDIGAYEFTTNTVPGSDKPRKIRIGQ